MKFPKEFQKKIHKSEAVTSNLWISLTQLFEYLQFILKIPFGIN